MALSRDSRTEQKLKAIRLAQFRLRQRLEAIDWREDVLLPEIEALKSGRSVLGLTEGAVFDIEVVHEDSRPSKNAPERTASAGASDHPRAARSRSRAKSRRPRARL